MQDLQTFLNAREMLVSFIQEDVGAGDITSSSIIPKNINVSAEIVCKSEPAIIAGLEEARMIFDMCQCTSRIIVNDGSSVKKGTVVMKVSGSARKILLAERSVLNIIMRMSGIATTTNRIVTLAKDVKILATRKTAPGLRYFDKKAVVLGGGGTHRMRLDDMILIKDNHLVIIKDIQKSIKFAEKNIGSSVNIECETKNIKETLEAVSAGANIIMLDNFTPHAVARTIKLLTKMGLRKKVKIEVSGGVTERNVRQYAQSKPDFISVGYITHSAKAVDVSLEIMK